jgi:predicted dehydrogenase
MSMSMNRRDFLRSTALVGAGLCVAPRIVWGEMKSPNEKLDIAGIGVGGRGADDMGGVSGENIVALCDVDEKQAGATFKRFPKAKKYHDFRKMLEEDKGIDAVVIATPDHTHAPAAVMAMSLGKHVYCEKPLTHSIYEARVMKQTAAKYRVATQMGIQGHSYDGHRRAVELLQAGAIGQVREVHVWSDRPIWPQGIDRPKDTPPVPKHLDWELWLGPAPWRPYHPAYVPFKWRGWWDFGTGALGDMGIHNADVAFWGLKLGAPTSAEAEVSDVHAETAPNWSIIRFEFPARGTLPPVKLTWYDGGKKPAKELAHGQDIPTNGALLIGEKGTLFSPDWHADQFKLLPEKEFQGFEGPERTIPRSPGHHEEWVIACKGGPAAMAEFSYSAPMTEAVLLGNAAIRAGEKLEWDAENLKITNSVKANQFIRRDYRSGWTL